MRITRWHVGKLVILWTWGIVLILLALVGVYAVPSERLLLGSFLLLFALAIPVVLSIITWIWLGGREDKQKH
jgi:hypothetical protein